MLLSEIIPIAAPDIDNAELCNEIEFERFSRITSKTECTACVYIGDESYIKKITDDVSMVITTREIASKLQGRDIGLCISSNPKLLYFRLLDYINKNIEEKGAPTVFGKSVSISAHAVIYPNDVVIGDNVIIEEFAVIYPHTYIDSGTIIRAGAKIGVQDYNYYSDGDNLTHIKHAGMVKIGKNVEIGYNSVVGRALYIGDCTTIGDNTKVSHNCCIGHDVQLGKSTMIYSGTIIGGYVTVGDSAHVTMNCTIKNGIKIGRESMVCMGSNVIMNVRDNAKVFGNPAKNLKM